MITDPEIANEAVMSVLRKVKADADALGAGWLRISRDGDAVVFDRIRPSEVLHMPDDPEIPE